MGMKLKQYLDSEGALFICLCGDNTWPGGGERKLEAAVAVAVVVAVAMPVAALSSGKGSTPIKTCAVA